jgi:hypothetical protein
MTTHWIWPRAQLLAAAARGPRRRRRSSSGDADGGRHGAPSQQAAPRPGGGGAVRGGAGSGGPVRGTPSPPPPSSLSSSGRRGHERIREIFLGSRLPWRTDEPLIFLFFFLSLFPASFFSSSVALVGQRALEKAHSAHNGSWLASGIDMTFSSSGISISNNHKPLNLYWFSTPAAPPRS